MPQIVPMTLDDGSVIYIQADDALEAPEVVSMPEVGRTPKGDVGEMLDESVESLQGTIRHYTNHVLGAFDTVRNGNIEKVTLEFGIKIAGKAGIPYITEGSAEGSVSVKVECTWPSEANAPTNSEESRNARDLQP